MPTGRSGKKRRTRKVRAPRIRRPRALKEWTCTCATSPEALRADVRQLTQDRPGVAQPSAGDTVQALLARRPMDADTAVRIALKDRPQAVGLAVPGMPVGAPGMDGAAYGGRRDAYDVLLVSRSAEARVFTSYNKT